MGWTMNYSIYLTILLACYYAILKAGIVTLAFTLSFRKSIAYFLSVFSIFWIGLEYLEFQSQAFCPWLVLGNSLAEYLPIIQFYSITGVLGGTLLILLVNQSLFLWKESQKIAGVYIVASLIFFTTSLGFYFFKDKKGIDLSIALIQPNFESNLDNKLGSDASYNFRKNTFFKTICNIQSADLVIFPETAINILLNQNNLNSCSLIPFFDSLSAQNNIKNYLIGMYSYNNMSTQKMYNSVLFYEPSTHKTSLYSKVKLVPIVEQKNVFNKIIQNMGDTLFGAFSGGKNSKSFVLNNGIKVISAICYESIYPQCFSSRTNDKPSIITLSTNDIYFANTIGIRQHLNMCRIRAIESNRYLARASNNGTTCIINNKGELEKSIPSNTTSVLIAKIYAISGQTIFNKLGDWFVIFISICIHLSQLNLK